MRFLSLIPALYGLQTVSAALISRNFPHLIVPVNANTPDTVYGTKYEANIEQTVHTEISFDVPSNGAISCKLGFAFSLDPNIGAPWYVWGDSPFSFNISTIDRPINKDTDTWNNHPKPVYWVATVDVEPSGRITISGGYVNCWKGRPVQFLLYPASNAPGGIKWFELNNPLHGITFDMYDATE
ncbi:hypothetical protein K505DRAFT_230155 [Melanomma pulvis-pyrius CBS 109.77]|uniref:Ubiquitin 3 binding protein But2 C-terminal domain-containing protein n=1 Tax=Melanomma pulvis-pyrius CBS 109.77 TaxID=1314802 RepID=A0A6A6XVT9_9PLEO|nr:hypothetical protein K505DRAFT_230155 [Melanomma pulvis-pyrius CBS 109.77]